MNGRPLRGIFALSSGLFRLDLGVALERSAGMNGHQCLHFPCVVTAACEWSADHLKKSEVLLAFEAVALELFWSDEPVHAQMLGAGR